jgi:hypothetical protein
LKPGALQATVKLGGGESNSWIQLVPPRRHAKRAEKHNSPQVRADDGPARSCTQVELESKVLKPGFHFKGSIKGSQGLTQGASQAMDQVDATYTAPPADEEGELDEEREDAQAQKRPRDHRGYRAGGHGDAHGRQCDPRPRLSVRGVAAPKLNTSWKANFETRILPNFETRISHSWLVLSSHTHFSSNRARLQAMGLPTTAFNVLQPPPWRRSRCTRSPGARSSRR